MNLESSINILWMANTTYIVFLMQIGIAFVEAGSLRLKNLQFTLYKRCFEICIITLVWWLVGYGLAYGGGNNLMIGTDRFINQLAFDDYNNYIHFNVQLNFALICAAIASGCNVERITLIGDILCGVLLTSWTYPIVVHWVWGGGWLSELGFYDFAGSGVVYITSGCTEKQEFSYLTLIGDILCGVLLTSWTYPIVVHWVWGGGWLSELGFYDFAGSGVVYITSGCTGLLSTYKLGARNNRFHKTQGQEFRPHNLVFCVVGSLVQWYAWYGFNCGSVFEIVGQGSRIVPLVGVNTTLAAVASGLSSQLIHYGINYNTQKRFSVSVLGNGIVSGLVVICASCDCVTPFGSFIIGILGGITYQTLSRVLIKFKIDDPLDAIPVNGGCGVTGVLGVGFFHVEKGILYGDSGRLLAIQILGCLAIIVWAIICTYPFLVLLELFNLFRVPKQTELEGLDQHYFDVCEEEDKDFLQCLRRMQEISQKNTKDNQ